VQPQAGLRPPTVLAQPQQRLASSEFLESNLPRQGKTNQMSSSRADSLLAEVSWIHDLARTLCRDPCPARYLEPPPLHPLPESRHAPAQAHPDSGKLKLALEPKRLAS
jgi:hypothetical protein